MILSYKDLKKINFAFVSGNTATIGVTDNKDNKLIITVGNITVEKGNNKVFDSYVTGNAFEHSQLDMDVNSEEKETSEEATEKA